MPLNSREIRSLVISRWAPEVPRGGSALRLFQNLHGLARLGPVDVLSIGLPANGHHQGPVREWRHFDLERVASERPVRLQMWNRMWRIRSGAHPGMDAYWHGPAAAWLRRQLAENAYDVVVICEINLCRYLPVTVGSGVRVVYDAHNVECLLAGDLDAARFGGGASWWRRSSRRILRRRMATEENRLVQRVDGVWACSESDAKIFRGMVRDDGRAVVVPNCVNVGAYSGTREGKTNLDWTQHPVSALYLGSYSYFPNEDAAVRLLRDVLPRMVERDPGACAVVVGRDPTKAMQDLAVNQSRVQVTGAVESVLPYLAVPNILVLPINLGGGTRLKILEAFAAGTPVVSTHKGVEGIDATDGEHLLISDDPISMAALVVDLWKSRTRRMAMTDAAFRLVSKRYSWDFAANCIEQNLLRGSTNEGAVADMAANA